METVLIVIHLMIVVALVGTVLLQRSEGGALGIGGGGGGGLMSSRGAASALTRATAILAAAFFATSIALTLLHRQSVEAPSILEGVTGGETRPAAPGDQPAAPLLRREPVPPPAAPQVPQSQ